MHKDLQTLQSKTGRLSLDQQSGLGDEGNVITTVERKKGDVHCLKEERQMSRIRHLAPFTPSAPASILRTLPSLPLLTKMAISPNGCSGMLGVTGSPPSSSSSSSSSLYTEGLEDRSLSLIILSISNSNESSIGCCSAKWESASVASATLRKPSGSDGEAERESTSAAEQAEEVVGE
jgi:hypothetical protein